MSDFIVSARKYRPTTFASVVGQRSITSTLKNAISKGHLAQAYLFCGPRGVGKTTCARILAKPSIVRILRQKPNLVTSANRALVLTKTVLTISMSSMPLRITQSTI